MVQVITLPMDGGYTPRGNLVFEPYPVRQKRLGLSDNRNKGPLSLIPEAENEAHQARQAAYWAAIRAEEEAKKVHTCADWTFDMDEESPSVWCPACHHADWLSHSKASQQLIVDKYMREMHPELCLPERVVTQTPPITIKVSKFMKEMIEIGDATALMLRDSLTPGMSRPWWYYCEKADSEWLTRKAPEREALPTMSQEEYMAIQEQLHGPIAKKAPREEPYRPEPAFFARAQAAPVQASGGGGGAAVPNAVLSADEGKRMAAFAAWDATDRDVRKPYHKGRMVAGNCRRPRREVSDAHKVMLRNLPLEVESLRADMWELVAQVAPVTFLEGSKGIYITLATPRDVDAVMARFPNGVNYMGNVVTFERVGIARK
jgi:hypothetical protein